MVGLSYLLESLVNLFVMLVLLRFLFQAFRVDFYNPFAQAVVKATNPVLKPLRRMIPGWRGYDVASLVLALLLMLVKFQLILVLAGQLAPLYIVAWVALLQLLSLLLKLFFYAVIIQVVLSWINPMMLTTPVGRLLEQFVSPLLRPIQRMLPLMGGLDLSPAILLIVIQALQMWVGVP